MNRKQRLCLLVGFLLLIAATLFPPWRYSSGIGGFRYSGSAYGFLFRPPFGDATVNLSRLFVEWVLIAFVTFGLFLSQNNSRTLAPREDDPLGRDQEWLENPERGHGGRAWKRKFLIMK